MSEFNPLQQPQENIVSVVERVKPVTIGAPVAAIHFLGDKAVFVGDEEKVTFVDLDGKMSPVETHFGAILSIVSDGKRVVTGGDDGKVIAVDGKGETTVLATDAKRRWIDNVALQPEGALAWSAGKTAFVRSGKGDEKSLEVPSTVGGLAFAPKGLRLAIAHYNGVTLWFPNMAAKPEVLEWAGSHLGVTFSPDNKFVITSMHEPALHGWRLADARHMRMTGYPARVRSISWTVGGKGLATSGADTVIIWPFMAKDGPMGKEPGMLAPLKAQVTAVACHPKQDILAAGYSNGTVLLARMSDGAEILVRKNVGAPIAAVAWDADGAMLAYSDQAGVGGLLEFA